MHFPEPMTRSSPLVRPLPFAVALASLGVFYLLQTATPLRIDNDAVDYLRMGAAIADGRPLPVVTLPLGYPVFLALLDRAGLGSSFFFVLANGLFLGIGLWATWKIFDQIGVGLRQAIVLLTLLVTPVVRSVAAPLPETAFFAVSILALLAMKIGVSANGRRRLRWFTAAFVLAGLAMSVRLVAVALIPAFLWSCLVALHHPLDAKQGRRLGIVTVAVVLSLAVLVVALARMAVFEGYMSYPRYWYVYGQLTSPVTRRIAGTFSSLGELILNIPRSRFHNLRPLFIATGMVSAIGYLVTLRRPVRPTPVGIYLLSYVAVLVFWPYDSPRLWMPITPLLLALVVSSIGRLSWTPPVKLVITGYTAWFVLTGLGAIAYTTRISLSGDKFAQLYGRNGGMGSGNQEGPYTPESMAPYNALADSVLRRYGGHAWERR